MSGTAVVTVPDALWPAFVAALEASGIDLQDNAEEWKP